MSATTRLIILYSSFKNVKAPDRIAKAIRAAAASSTFSDITFCINRATVTSPATADKTISIETDEIIIHILLNNCTKIVYQEIAFKAL